MLGDAIGLATKERVQKLADKSAAMQKATQILQSARLPIGDSGTTAYEFLRRPEISTDELRTAAGEKLAQLFADPALAAVLPDVETDAKYAGYIEREKEAAKRMHELEDKTIPANFHFEGITELRAEARQSLVKFRPQTVGQASRLEGITPNDLTVLMLYLSGKRRASGAAS
jgi:tRNA uridine 5-carboxymethylaminomethyl modification enzyme